MFQMNLFEFFRFHQESLRGGVAIWEFESMAECCCELLDDIREKDFQGFFSQSEIDSFKQEAIVSLDKNEYDLKR
jgi:hypothetical protein